MLKFCAKRLLEAAPVFLIIVSATFFMARFVPGGPFDREKELPPETVEALNAYYGLDKPLHAQYFSFLKNLAKGDLGPSYKYQGFSVNELIREKAKVSLELGFYALIIALVAGVAAGAAASAFKRDFFGRLAGSASLLGICVPALVSGPILIFAFSLKLKIFNAMGWESFSDAVLPAVTLSMFYIAWIARLLKNSIDEEESKPYVRTAAAKGCSAKKIYFAHIFKNAMQPVVSYMGPAAAGLLTGSFVVETIFQIPGLGKFFISSALDNDYTMIVGCVIVYAGFIILFNLIADILLAALNPRISKSLRKK